MMMSPECGTPTVTMQSFAQVVAGVVVIFGCTLLASGAMANFLFGRDPGFSRIYAGTVLAVAIAGAYLLL
jgi:hypothetical protein